MKLFRVIASYGDGNPKKTVIKARNGLEAHDLAFKVYGGARSITILGLGSSQEPVPDLNEGSHLIFGCELTPQPKKKKKRNCSPRSGDAARLSRMELAFQMRTDGYTQNRIAEELGMSRGAVRRMLTSYTKQTQPTKSEQ